jgi:hypothetical protein
MAEINCGVFALEFVLILWVLCALFSYIVARDRAPSKAGSAALWGFLLGPIGIVIAFNMKEPEERSNADRAIIEEDVISYNAIAAFKYGSEYNPAELLKKNKR